MLLLWDSIYNKSRNISQVYQTQLHSLGTRSAVDLKRYSNISQVYRGWLHSLGTRSAVDLLKVFTTTGHTGRELRLIKPLWLIKIIVINQILSYGRRRADLIKLLTGREDDFFEVGPGSSFLRQTRNSAGSVFTSSL